MIDWHDFTEGQHRTACPACGRGKRDKTLGITIEAGKGVAHCFRCEYTETHRDDRSVMRRAPVKSAKLQSSFGKHETLSEYGLALWASCVALPGTVGEQYLTHRRCVVPPGDLRFHPALPHKPSGTSGPALVGLVTDAITGAPLTLHRTWITPTGKADLDPPRMLLGGHRKQGGVIRLWPDEYVTHGLAIAEGIETALSLAHAYQPVWACIDAGNLAELPALAGVEVLVIGADNDDAGQTAAHACASRWSANAEVRITRQTANDLNDALREVCA
ncbi:MAG: toprim domain-containing protein [Hydrogenophaga sp.]|nr:toprim domain-containing protein [Hydrogenophaga sp.]